MPSSLNFAFNSRLNSTFSEVDITEGEASIYLFSGDGARVRVVSGASLLEDPLFDRLLRDEALATGFVDDLEVDATTFLSSLLLIALSCPTFLPDPLLCADPLLEILLVDANPFWLFESLRVVLPCPPIDPTNSLLGPEPPCATFLVADTNSRARPTRRVEPAESPDSVSSETSGRVGVARLRNNLSSPV
jgi:hypothetical protein